VGIMIIGLTGGIASGKSTVSKYLAEKGFKVYDADKIAKDISEKKLVQRLQEQARFFANPNNKEKWQKERSENFVNERFCW